MKFFRLKRELPTFEIGDEFELRADGCLWLRSKGGNHWKDEVMAYHKRTLEKFPGILEEWFEEVEDIDVFWFIDEEGVVMSTERRFWPEESISAAEAIGNTFKTEEEAKKAVEKLKAWTRLKDKGFRFKGYTDDSGDLFSCQVVRCSFDDFGKESREDLCLLFSGGEE